MQHRYFIAVSIDILVEITYIYISFSEKSYILSFSIKNE